MDGVCFDSCDAFNSTRYLTTDSSTGASLCARCSPRCANESGCFGPSDAECGACRTLTVRATGRCAATCPDGTWVNGSWCDACDSSCGRSCTGPTTADCSDCRGVVLRSGLCGDVCGPNEVLLDDGNRCDCPEETAFVDSESGACVACHPQCLDGCTGTSRISFTCLLLKLF